MLLLISATSFIFYYAALVVSRKLVTVIYIGSTDFSEVKVNAVKLADAGLYNEAFIYIYSNLAGHLLMCWTVGYAIALNNIEGLK